MQERSVTHSTFVIERSYPAAPERVFAAFADPAKKRRWYAEDRGMATEAYEMDFRVGGREFARFRFQEGSPFPGSALENETTYQDIVTNQRVVIAYTMTLEGRRFSASQATIEFVPSDQGTKLVFTEQGAYFEGSDGAQMREAGWRKLLEKLAAALAQ
jgi:uncharacterized protein YndB with AHSA1/START domain